MKNIKDAIKFYYLASSLKETVRSGVLQWKVKGEIKETIAAHVFGSLMLAIALRDVLDIDLNFEKAFLMLAIHETEEIIIGDFTPFDAVTQKQKLDMGRKAVKKVFDFLENKHDYVELLDEFNELKTTEARFAKACDKLECVLEFKKYADSGRADFKVIQPMMKGSERLKKFYDAGKYTIDDVFYLWDMPQFEDLGFTEELWFNVIKPLASSYKDIIGSEDGK